MFISESKWAHSRLLLAKRVGLNMEVVLQKCLRVKVEMSTQLCLLWKGIQLEFDCHSTKFSLFYTITSQTYSSDHPGPSQTQLLCIWSFLHCPLPSPIHKCNFTNYSLKKNLFPLCCILLRKTFSELLCQLSVPSCLLIPRKTFFF